MREVSGAGEDEEGVGRMSWKLHLWDSVEISMSELILQGHHPRNEAARKGTESLLLSNDVEAVEDRNVLV